MNANSRLLAASKPTFMLICIRSVDNGEKMKIVPCTRQYRDLQRVELS